MSEPTCFKSAEIEQANRTRRQANFRADREI
jgi:hypothetical protein